MAVVVDARGYSCPEPVMQMRAAEQQGKFPIEVLVETVTSRENVRRAAESARLLQEAGVIVLATFISPTIASREKARAIARNGLFFEIYVKASLQTCIKRDPKGFYQKAQNGEIKNYTGIDSIYEEPLHADLVLNTDLNNADVCVQQLLEFALNNGIISKEA